jgi:uncharacterized protein (TIGR02145 family)
MRRLKIILAAISVVFAVSLLPFTISCLGLDGLPGRDGFDGEDGLNGQDGRPGNDCVVGDDPDDSAYLLMTCGVGDGATTERWAKAMCGAEAYDPKWGFICRRGSLAFADERDGQYYRVARIGTQFWMAENLNWAGDGGNLGWCYGNESGNCDVYGRLYNWSTVMDFGGSCNTSSCTEDIQLTHRGICPEGWHVPDSAQWNTLINFVGSDAGTKLKSTSGWNSGGNGTNDYGFSALPGGEHNGDEDDFRHVGTHGNWWGTTESNVVSNAHVRSMGSSSNTVSSSWGNKISGYSLRCVAD